jgi:hypothetical protein
MSYEKRLRYKTLSSIARRAVNGPFDSATVYGLVLSEDPETVLVEVDTNGAIGPVSGLMRAVIHVQPGPHAAELADRIWWSFGWEDVFEDAVDPADAGDLAAKGWYCRFKLYFH